MGVVIFHAILPDTEVQKALFFFWQTWDAQAIHLVISAINFSSTKAETQTVNQAKCLGLFNSVIYRSGIDIQGLHGCPGLKWKKVSYWIRHPSKTQQRLTS